MIPTIRSIYLLLLLLLSGCGPIVKSQWEPHTVRTYAPICPRLVRFYEGDSADLVRAGAVILGEIDGSGNGYSGQDDLAKSAEVEALAHGGTHIMQTTQGVDTTTVPIGAASTRCSSWGNTTDCSSRPPPTVTLRFPRARFVVLRVERENWPLLPAQLRPPAVCDRG